MKIGILLFSLLILTGCYGEYAYKNTKQGYHDSVVASEQRRRVWLEEIHQDGDLKLGGLHWCCWSTQKWWGPKDYEPRFR